MTEVVLDASAVLAFLRDEPGADVVSQALVRGKMISAVNWTEVTGRFAEAGHDPQEVDRLLDDDGALGCGALLVLPFERSDSILVAKLRPLTQHLGLSLGTEPFSLWAKGWDFPSSPPIGFGPKSG